MKTFLILAAGRGSRFGQGNKLLKKFDGYSLPQYAAMFALYNGAERICVTLGKDLIETDGHTIYHPIYRDLLGICPSKIEVAFQPEGHYGPGAAITCWQQKITENFTVLFGDNFYRGILPNIPETWTWFSTKEFVTNPRNLELAAVIEDYVIEKPHGYISGEYFCGFVHFDRDFWKRLPMMTKSDRNEYEITDLINLSPVRHKAPLSLDWGELTYPDDKKQLMEVIKNGGSFRSETEV